LRSIAVALDVTPAVVGFGGVERYAASFWAALCEREDIDVHAFAAGRGRRLEGAVRQTRVPLRILHHAWSLSGRPRAEDLVGDIDLVHSMDLIPPPTRRPLVMTIHDVLALTHPDLCSPRARLTQERQLRLAPRASLLVTTCEATADAVADVTGLSRERVVATSLGQRKPAGAGVGSEVGGPFVLAVGAITPRKGFDVLARAANRVAGFPRVLIAGPDGWGAAAVRAQVAAADTRRLVRFLGPVSDGRLDALYRDALFVCHPSHAEGFGIACVEAMGFGRALVATDLDATREITGDVAELVPPGEVEPLANALERILSDAQLRTSMGVAGLNRAERFTWEAATSNLVAAYRLALD